MDSGHFLHTPFICKFLKGPVAFFSTYDISVGREILSEIDLMGINEALMVNRHCVSCLRHRLQARGSCDGDIVLSCLSVHLKISKTRPCFHTEHIVHQVIRSLSHHLLIVLQILKGGSVIMELTLYNFTMRE